MKGISVCIPLYNEEQNAPLVYQELKGVLEKLNMSYEMIFVDDGSKDRTVQSLMRAVAEDNTVSIIQFRRNFGQTAAMAAGLEHSKYDKVVLMDGDLQNDPAELPKMIAKLEEGYDMVAGWRKKRQDNYLYRNLPSMIGNKVISWATGVKLHDYGCSLKLMTSEVAKGIKLYGEMHRFIPALAAQFGARIAEVPVNHRARQFGVSKYGLSKTVRVILDLITVKFLLGYAKRPIHLFGSLGLIAGGIGFFTLAWLTFQRFFMHIPMGNRPLLSLGVMCVMIGFQFLVFGLLAEVLARTYHESQDKAVYVVRNYFENGKQVTPEELWKRKVA